MKLQAKLIEFDESSLFKDEPYEEPQIEERLYVGALPPEPLPTPEEKRASFISTSIAVGLFVFATTAVYFAIPQKQEPLYTAEHTQVYKEKNDGDPRFLYIPNQDYITIVDEVKEGRNMSALFDKSYRGYASYDERIVALEEKYYRSSRAVDNSKLVQIENKEKYHDYRVPSTMSCDIFRSENAAYEAVSKLSFEGVTARIVKHKQAYRLELGPYASKQEAHQVFTAMKRKNILTSCRLIIF